MGALRRYLIAGVIALAPLLVTVAIVDWLLKLSDKALALLPAAYQPASWLGMEIPGFGVLLAVVFIIVVGAVTTHVLGRRLMRLFDRLMERIPLIRTVHKTTRQLLGTLFSDSSRAFREVVLVPFPKPGQWAIGFVTGEGHMPAEAGGARCLAVFVPSTPLPTTGWLLFVAPEDLTRMDISVEEGMKLVLSGGVLSLDEARRRVEE
ncbi:MAG: DUF502 domain-containing protein [Zetaproteobacteria bacterium]|nr:MAG: DUF502 domain-containing protein [Zetaproteobacteria bacterium]